MKKVSYEVNIVLIVYLKLLSKSQFLTVFPIQQKLANDEF